MSFMLYGEKKFIIDKTVIEVVKKNKDIKKEELIKFCSLLKNIGADFIEIDSSAMKIMNSLIKGMNYIFRIENINDIKIFNNYNFKYVVVKLDNVSKFDLKNIKNLSKVKFIFEVALQDIMKIYEDKNWSYLKNILLEMKEQLLVHSLRIKGVSNCILSNWDEIIKRLKEELKIKIDVCPTNEFYIGTAVAVEAAVSGADYITATFSGKGYKVGFAALEEVLLALKVIKGYILSGNTKLLPEVSEYYKIITKKDIYKTKAVIGADIFKCESGIHVDGIEKKADTYEPYNPREVGQKRQIVIGKHSGSKAIINKLKELNINLSRLNIENILEEVKALSMQLRHEVSDEELIKIAALK